MSLKPLRSCSRTGRLDNACPWGVRGVSYDICVSGQTTLVEPLPMKRDKGKRNGLSRRAVEMVAQPCFTNDLERKKKKRRRRTLDMKRPKAPPSAKPIPPAMIDFVRH